MQTAGQSADALQEAGRDMPATASCGDTSRISKPRRIRIVVALCCAALIAVVWSASASAAVATVHPYLSSFGSFSNVQGVATDAAGNVYVYDTGAAAIFKFDASGNPVNFVATGKNEIAGVSGGGSSENEIAVDNSKGPTAGDIYLANGSPAALKIFNPEGSPIGTLTPEEGIPWNGEACGVAVGTSGAVYIGNFSGQILKYVPKANPVTNADYSSSIEGAESPCNIAVDEAGNVFSEKWSEGPITRYEPSQFGTSSAAGSTLDSKGSTLAVDPASQEVFVDEQDQVTQFGPHDEPVSTFGASGEGAISNSFGIAVGPVNHDIYVSGGSGTLDVFGTVAGGHVPTVTTGSASDVIAGGATLNGTVNPEEAPVGECFFEYGESRAYGKTVPCVESAAEIGSGNAPVAVHANVTGLVAITGDEYHFRLVAAQTIKGFGEDSSFVALLPPLVESQYVTDVTSASATLQGTLNPRAHDTTYHFEYGIDTNYGSSTPELDAGASNTSTPLAAAHPEGLTADTIYHYRLVATSSVGTTDGPDGTFTTESAGGPLSLLDNRKWELVSPPVKYGAGIRKEAAGGGSAVQASASGNAITYIASDPIEEEPEGNSSPEDSQIISKRGADGTWSTHTLDLPNTEVHSLPIGHGLSFKMFNSDLSTAIIEDYGPTKLAPEATVERAPYVREEGACNEHSSNCFTPFLTRANTKPGAKWDANPAGLLLQTRFVDATEDLKYSVMSAEVGLTEGAAEAGGLYERSEGHLENISINEAGESVPGQLGGEEEANVRGAISTDGTRLFWCEDECSTFSGGPLLMRDTATGRTLRIDETSDFDPDFQIATADGSRVFYTTEQLGPFVQQLWECTIVEVAGKLECERAQVAPQAEGLVLGINSSGTSVYFDSKSALTEGAEAEGNNLYVSDLVNGKWVPHLIAVLDPKHGAYEGDTRDWAGPNNEIQAMTARVSPNGRYLAFMSDRSLTGYDNNDAVSGKPDQEVFLYDDQEHKLVCASCDRHGARPKGLVFGVAEQEPLIDSHGVLGNYSVAADIPAWEASTLDNGLRQPRYLSDEGRLFFNSAAPLVPQDTNGLGDVYEYEPDTTGSCAQTGGCVQLISSGTSGEESTFLEADESGDNAFFITTARLAPQDDDTEYDVYDARVCNEADPCWQAAVTPPPCTSGEACKPAPTPQPTNFGAPASGTFSGAGNLVPPAATPPPKAKPLTSAQKLAKALKTCHRDKSRAKRLSCEKQARKRYGPKPKAKSKSSKAKAHKGGK